METREKEPTIAMAELLQFPESSTSTQPHAISQGSASDAEARRAALDIQRSWIVEAPAGSGKTGLLIQRLLKLLAFGDVQRPGEVLAITFTRKAAAELRHRVLEQLKDAAAAKPLKENAGEYERITRELALGALSRDRQLGWHLLETPHGLNIRTIDSFCSELARGLPLLSGGVGSRQIVDDAQPLYDRAAERAFRELGASDPVLDEALRCVLLHRDAQIGDALRLVSGMLADREQWSELIPLDAEALTEEALDGPVKRRLEGTLEHVVCQGLSRATSRISRDLLAELSHFAASRSTAPGHKGNASPIASCVGLPHAPGSKVSDRDHWLALLRILLTQDGGWRSSVAVNHIGFRLTKTDALWLKDLIEQLKSEDYRRPGLREALCAVRGLPPTQYPDDQWRVAKALFRVLRRAMAELRVLFAEQSVCDFTEIALTARRLLGTDPHLLENPGNHLTHLLVDEMQDTSAGQYELLELLTRSWDGATQTLFLVGDPKQSIYMFRQARVARFLRTQAAGRLGDLVLGTLRLTANFRSQAELVDDLNAVFGQILPSLEDLVDESEEEVEVPFVAAFPTRARSARPALRWHARLVAGDGLDAYEDDGDPQERADPEAADDAAMIRQIIETFRADWQNRLSLDGPRRPAKIVVLARSRAHLAPVIAEFHRDRGRGPLVFRAVEIELLNERPEVLDLLALTRALLHRGDRVAWLAVLRSPVCGLELADLLALTGDGPDADPAATVPHLVASRAHLLSPGGQRLLARAWPVLAAAQDSLGRTALSTHVERTWRSLGADAPLSPDQRANARQFIQLLQELEVGREPLSLPLLQRGLAKLYAEPPSAPDAIEFMTIHKAKGLEWDLVLVPGLERGAGNSGHELLKWLELDGEPGCEAKVILAPIPGKGEQSSALSTWLARLEKAREAAEAKRLFYVVCTRAREELHLFAACKRKRDGELAKPQSSSLLRACWTAAEPIISRQFAAGKPAPLRRADQESAVRTESFALAASVDDETGRSETFEAVPATIVRRLPENFDPMQRLRAAAVDRLPYPAAGLLRHATPFKRPEGSFAARAFGNAVHRFLDLIAQQIAGGRSAEEILKEIPLWRDRISTVFRAEGLSAGSGARETTRSLSALEATLRDPTGRWILGPRPGARSERSLQVGSTGTFEEMGRNVRADRIFVAGPEPLSTEVESHLWIVDFKTAEQGGRSAQAFFAAERAKYEPQMQAYAQASAAAAETDRPIMLALFYPLVTQLLYWPFTPFLASE